MLQAEEPKRKPTHVPGQGPPSGYPARSVVPRDAPTHDSAPPVYKTRNHLLIRDAKGMKDRITVLPDNLKPLLREHIERVRLLHHQDLANSYGRVYLPFALDRKYSNAGIEWGWQYAFPAKSLSRDPRTGETRRHHIHESNLQAAVHTAVRLADIGKPVSVHSFRHGLATHLLEANYDIRTAQELLGHKDVSTPMIYTHVLNRPGLSVKSPLDG